MEHTHHTCTYSANGAVQDESVPLFRVVFYLQSTRQCDDPHTDTDTQACIEAILAQSAQSPPHVHQSPYPLNECSRAPILSCLLSHAAYPCRRWGIIGGFDGGSCHAGSITAVPCNRITLLISLNPQQFFSLRSTRQHHACNDPSPKLVSRPLATTSAQGGLSRSSVCLHPCVAMGTSCVRLVWRITPAATEGLAVAAKASVNPLVKRAWPIVLILSAGSAVVGLRAMPGVFL